MSVHCLVQRKLWGGALYLRCNSRVRRRIVDVVQHAAGVVSDITIYRMFWNSTQCPSRIRRIVRSILVPKLG
jgi:hypothetical protein